jgi:hypothetical protein
MSDEYVGFVFQSKNIKTLMEKAQERQRQHDNVFEKNLREVEMITFMPTRISLLQLLIRGNLQSRRNGWRKSVCVNLKRRKRMYVQPFLLLL